MTTANRAPNRNYVGRTVRSCLEAGLVPILFATDSDLEWLWSFVREEVPIRVPARCLTRIENGAAALLGAPEADWVLHLEDDVLACADASGSLVRWLERYARLDRRIVLFFSNERYPKVGVVDHSVKRPFTAQAVAMRWPDAQAMGQWALDHVATWRSGTARLRGFDRMMLAWHTEQYPNIPAVSVSVPSLFQHIGTQSSLAHLGHAGRFPKSPTFTGQAWHG
jgi:hypothetical protein